MPEKVALSNSSKSTMERANKAHKKALRKLSRTLLYNGTDDDACACLRLLQPHSLLLHAPALTPRLQQTATAQTAQWRRRRIRCLMKSCSEAQLRRMRRNQLPQRCSLQAAASARPVTCDSCDV